VVAAAPVASPVVVATEDGVVVAPALALEVGADEAVDAQETEAGRLVTPLVMQSCSAYLVAAS
jgi:hypothetical protein